MKSIVPSLVAFAMLLGLVVSYAAAYCVSVRTISQGELRFPYYVVGGDLAPAFFRPAERVDRWLRPDSWGRF